MLLNKVPDFENFMFKGSLVTAELSAWSAFSHANEDTN